MANVKHAGRKRKLNVGDDDRAYQKRQSKKFKEMNKALKEVQPTPPSHLDKHGKWLWRQIVPELQKIGNIKYLDQLNLAALCSAYSDFRTAEEEIAKDGPYPLAYIEFPQVMTYKNAKGKEVQKIVKVTKQVQDKTKPNPMFSVKNTAERTMKTLCADLGMSFNARAAANIESENYHAQNKNAETSSGSPLGLVKFNGV